MPASAVTHPDHVIDPDTAARLRIVVAKMSKRLNALARGSGMTPTEFSVLGTIARRGPLRLSELAELESLNPTMLSRIVANLDEQGLVRRRPDPTDRRAGRVEVSAAGRRRFEKLRAERSRVVTAGLQDLPPAQLASVEAALPALEAVVEAMTRG
jgi:DNA-binding MarR family transcriptional regulator